MFLFIIGFILTVLVLFFIFIYDHCGLNFRTRKLLSEIPGYSELECAKLAFNLAVGKFHIREIYVEAAKKFSKYPLYKGIFMGTPRIQVLTPEYIQEVLTSSQCTTKGKDYFVFEPFLREGLLTSNGSKWQSRRRMLNPAFMHHQLMEHYTIVFNESSAALVEKLKVYADTKETFSVEPYIAQSTLNAICESAMGVSVTPQTEERKKCNAEFIAAAQRVNHVGNIRYRRFWLHKDWAFNMTSLAKDYYKCISVIDEFVDMIIKERKGKLKDTSSAIKDECEMTAFIDFLIQLNDKELGVFSDSDLREEVCTFIIAGFETTAITSSFALLLLGAYPDCQQQAYDEIHAILGSDDRKITVQDLSRMEYLDRVIKETLRIYPTVPYFTRSIINDTKIGDYTLPGGSVVSVCPWVIHHNETFYPDPYKFDPDRFLASEVNKRHPYSYLPFSRGHRSCLGQRYATMEIKVLLAYLLRNFVFESITDVNTKDMVDFIPTIRVNKGIIIKIFPR